MASTAQYLNNLIYKYLQSKDPKCAALFSKSFEVGITPPDFPALEDIVKFALKEKELCKSKLQTKDSDKAASRQQQSAEKISNVSLLQNKQKAQDSDDSSDSSESESLPVKPGLSAFKAKPVSHTKKQSSSSSDSDSNSGLNQRSLSHQNPPLQKPVIKNAESTSDSSDSEDERAKKNVSRSPLKKIDNISAKNLGHLNLKSGANTLNPVSKLKSITQNVALQKKQDSSTSDESDSESEKATSGSSKINSKQIAKTVQMKVVPKTQDSSDDSSSESDHTVQMKSKPEQSSTNSWSSAISKFAAQYPNDSDSESEDEKGVVVSLSGKSSTPINNDHKKILPKLSVQKDSSSTSSSDSEDTSVVTNIQGAQPKQIKNKNISLANSSNPAIKKGMSNMPSSALDVTTKSATRDSSSESDEEQLKTNIQEKLKQKNLNVSGKKSESLSNSVISGKKLNDTSSDSSSDSEEGEGVKSKSQTAKPIKGALNAKNRSLTSPLNSTIKKIVQKSPLASNKTTNDTSSDSSSDSDNDKSVKSKSQKATPVQSALGPKNVLPTNLSKSAVKGLVQKSPFASNKKAGDSSSDSSSDSESEEPVNSKSQAKPVQSAIHLKNKLLASPHKNVNDTSSDSSDSEDGEPVKSKLLGTKPVKSSSGAKKASVVKSIVSTSGVHKNLVVRGMVAPVVDNTSSDTSSVSEDEAKSAVQALSSRKVMQKVGQGKSISEDVKKSPVSPNEKMQTNKGKTDMKSPKLLQKTRKKSTSDSSSDSSDSEDHKQSQISAVQWKTGDVTTKGNTKPNLKDTSSDSDSEEESKATKASKTPLKNTPVPVPSKKESDSSDSSSDDETKPPVVKPTTKPIHASKKIGINNAVISNNDNSSDSDSEEPTKNTSAKQASPAVLSSLKPANNKKASSDSSDSSDDEKQPIPTRINQTKATHVQSISTKSSSENEKNSAIRAKQITSHNSSSSSDSEDKPSQSVSVSNINKSLKNRSIKSKSSKNSSSSDSSSSSEDQSNTASKGTTLNTSSNIIAHQLPKKIQEDSSDSESTVENKSVPTKKISASLTKSSEMISKSPFANKSFNSKKKESSSDSSSSEDEKESTRCKPAVASLQQNKRKRESSDSSSDSETDNLQNQVNNIVTSASLNAKRKRDSTSSDSDNEDLQPNTPLPASITQPHKIQKLNSQSSIPVTNQDNLKNQNENKASTTRRRGSSPFRRIKSENIRIDHRMQQSNQLAKHELPSLAAARGKQFRHEKTKKKKGSHSFGKVDVSAVKSIKFD